MRSSFLEQMSIKRFVLNRDQNVSFLADSGQNGCEIDGRGFRLVLADVDNNQKRGAISRFFPGIDFTNILCAAFTLVDPKSAKRHSLTVFFCTVGI